MAIHLDFEGFSKVDLKASGAFRYAEDPSTLALMFGYCIGDAPVIMVDLTETNLGAPVPSSAHPLFEAVRRGIIVAAHNSQFERLIWEKVCHYFPVTPGRRQWDCTAARSRMLAMPGSLDGAAAAIGLDTRKDPRGKELINIFCKPHPKTGKRTLPSEAPEFWKEFIEYCRQDVEVERELDQILPPLSEVEAEAFAVDYEINDRGLPVNMDLVNKAAGFVEEYSARLMKRAVDISGCRPTQREKTIEFFASRGHKLPDLQAPTVEALAKKKGLHPDLVELVDLRIELSRAGTKKLKAIQNTVCSDGRIRGSFLFSAASTRRWSSTGVQVHNLQKPEGEVNPECVFELLAADAELLPDLFDRPLTAIAQSIRGFFEAENDEVFHIADYSSVEPRGLGWVAGEEWLLEAYRKNQDAYKIAASKVYGIPPDKIAKDSVERFMGKQLILGCGYGMGPPRFIETCAKFGQVLTLDQSTKAVYGYRSSVPNIVKLWKTVEAACIRAVKDWKVIRVGKLQFRPETLSNGYQVLYVDMPSGSICYPAPRVGKEFWNGQPRETFNFYTPLGSGWVETDTFGGSLVENIIQALTRDILRDGLVAANRAGHHVVGHVHDEGLALGRNNKADLKDFENCLTGSSPWAKNFPIGVDGFMSKRYKK